MINRKIEKGKSFQKEHVKADPGLRKNKKSSLLNFPARELPSNFHFGAVTRSRGQARSVPCEVTFVSATL